MSVIEMDRGFRPHLPRPAPGMATNGSQVRLLRRIADLEERIDRYGPVDDDTMDRLHDQLAGLYERLVDTPRLPGVRVARRYGR